MFNQRVYSKLITLQDLPTLPEVMTRILESVSDENTSAEEIAELLSSDHAISARVLRLANSAFYALRHPVDSIKRAVVVIGFDAVQNLALATSVIDAFSTADQFALDPKDFWLHSLGSAHTAKFICDEYQKVGSPDGCFTAALLHDIGKYVFALVMKKEYAEVIKHSKAEGIPLYELEKKQFETTHSEIGTWLADKWRFPDLIKTVIANFNNFSEYRGEFRNEVAIVIVSDRISRTVGFGSAGDGAEPEYPVAALESLALTKDHVEDITEQMRNSIEGTRELFNMMLGKGH
jgi:HD-like signal output (HDOD) protein